MSREERKASADAAIARVVVSENARIAAGARLPTTGELHNGAPFLDDRFENDVAAWVAAQLEGTPRFSDDICAEFRRVSTCIETTTLTPLRAAVLSALHQTRDERLGDILKRIDFYLAALGSDDHVKALIERWERGIEANRPDAGRFLFLSIGLKRARHFNSVADLEERGRNRHEIVCRVVDRWDRACSIDQAEKTNSTNQFGLTVVPTLPEGGGVSQKEVRKLFAPIAGTPLPFVVRGDVGAHRRALATRWPHATAVIDQILGDLAAAEHVLLRPTIFVGPPGSGKTALAEAIADTLGLPRTRYDAGGTSDASFIGTSAQWSNARPSVPLQLICQHQKACGLVIIDEIEKAHTSHYGGGIHEGLLPFLERDQARRVRDLSLEVDVDLSGLSYILTANTLDGIPWPIRDRCRVLEMPSPTWKHISSLLPGVLADIARERGLDRRWLSDLADDELAVLKRHWPGGSLRRLRRAVEVLVDGRNHLMGRA